MLSRCLLLSLALAMLVVERTVALIKPAVDRDGDTLTVLDVLARQVVVGGMFSDWPATTTSYASCMGMK